MPGGSAPSTSRGQRGLHQFPTPRLGGLAILAGVIAAGLVFLPPDQQTTGILIGAAVIVAVGVADDLLDLSADVKLAGQVLAAVIPVAARRARRDHDAAVPRPPRPR